MESVSRRTFLKAGAGVAGVGAVPKALRSAHGKLNVLFIGVDDLNHSLGCYGEPVHTPNIDALAERGARFDAAYCQYPLCGPSRTSLLSGLAPDYNGTLDNFEDFRRTPDMVTLPELFRKNGYYTARVGKIYHSRNPMQEGEDGADDPKSWEYKFNNAGIDRKEQLDKLQRYAEQPGVNLGGTIGAYQSPSSDRQITDGVGADEVIRLLKEKKDGPFFIAYGLYRPHLPWIAPEAYFKMYPLEKVHAEPFDPAEMTQAPRPAYSSTKPNLDMDEKSCRLAKAAYYACTSYMDAQVGRVLDALKKEGLDRNTLVVFWADHGWMLGQHGMWQKMTLFEWTARIPFMMAGPGIAPKTVIKKTTEHLDIYPTLVEMCGLQGMPKLHGKSMAKLVTKPGTATWDKPAVTQIHKGGGKSPAIGYSLRTERYRYTMWMGHTVGEELYDYQNDPREVKNLAADASMAELKKGLRGRLEGIVETRKRKPA